MDLNFDMTGWWDRFGERLGLNPEPAEPRPVCNTLAARNCWSEVPVPPEAQVAIGTKTGVEDLKGALIARRFHNAIYVLDQHKCGGWSVSIVGRFHLEVDAHPEQNPFAWALDVVCKQHVKAGEA